MSAIAHGAAHTISQVGYGAVGLAVGIKGIGIPFPGETTLIAAALYAGATHQRNVVVVVLVATIGAILDDSVGFVIGREFGSRLLVKYGHYIRMTKPRTKLGQYLFLRHGGKVAFFGRFIAILRALAAFLAGANRMSWPRFLVFNAAGGIVWAASYGFGAYFFATAMHDFMGPVGIVLTVAAAAGIIASVAFLRRNERRPEEEAENALPGPIRQRPVHVKA
ncbi:MAG: DedA family protein [Acetobacteraceae bacterium]